MLSESQSRALNVQLAELALARLGARPFHVIVPTPRQSAPVPIRSTGASVALQNLAPGDRRARGFGVRRRLHASKA